jgi:hypothetical protein
MRSSLGGWAVDPENAGSHGPTVQVQADEERYRNLVQRQPFSVLVLAGNGAVRLTRTGAGG